MLTLSFDTATASLALALCLDGDVLANAASVGERRHAERLMPAIDELLRDHDKTVRDVDLVVVGNGPGSYTGIRIGLATALGLAFGETGLVTVSTLRGMAAGVNAKPNDLVVPVIDARGGRLFAAVYRSELAQEVVLVDQQTTVSALSDALNHLVATHADRDAGGEIILAGSGASLLAEALPPATAWRERVLETCWPDAAQMARIGERHFQQEGGMDHHAVRPFYAAKTQAERMAGR